MNPNTEMGGGARIFPKTRWSVLREARDPESPTFRTSLEELARMYWRPVYAHFRRKWGKSNEEAKDLSQEFFLALCERNFLPRLDSGQGRFRHYVMTALDNFARLRHRQDHAQKRGGGALHFSLDVGDGYDVPANETPEQVFRREWASTILDHALEELEQESRARGTEAAFRLFLLREVEAAPGEDVTYEALARRFEMNLHDVKNSLYRTRQRFREIVHRIVCDSVATPEEAEDEMRELFEGLTS